jgi:hypothetical protein
MAAPTLSIQLEVNSPEYFGNYLAAALACVLFRK